MRIPEGFHVEGGSSDAFGLTPEEVLEERRARKEEENGRKRARGQWPGSRRAPPIKNPFDEILKSIGLWERVQASCAEVGVAPFEMVTGGRSKRLVLARKRVYLMLREIGWSLTDIGRLFDLDHTTVLHALK